MYKEIGKLMMAIGEETGILKYLEQYVYWLNIKLNKLYKIYKELFTWKK